MSTAGATQEDCQQQLDRALHDLVRAYDRLHAAETALDRVLHDKVGRRHWLPHPMLPLLSDAALLAEIERRGIARWESILHEHRAERTAKAIIEELRAKLP